MKCDLEPISTHKIPLPIKGNSKTIQKLLLGVILKEREHALNAEMNQKQNDLLLPHFIYTEQQSCLSHLLFLHFVWQRQVLFLFLIKIVEFKIYLFAFPVELFSGLLMSNTKILPQNEYPNFTFLLNLNLFGPGRRNIVLLTVLSWCEILDLIISYENTVSLE